MVTMNDSPNKISPDDSYLESLMSISAHLSGPLRTSALCTYEDQTTFVHVHYNTRQIRLDRSIMNNVLSNTSWLPREGSHPSDKQEFMFGVTAYIFYLW